MAEKLQKWPSIGGPISKIRPSDGCEKETVPLAVRRWLDFQGFACRLGNVGLKAMSTVLACSLSYANRRSMGLLLVGIVALLPCVSASEEPIPVLFYD